MFLEESSNTELGSGAKLWTQFPAYMKQER